MAHYFVILGAAVWPGGRPSGSMRRRVAGALAAAAGCADARFLATGSVGRHPPSEALAMRQLLRAAGVPDGRIALEELGTDTLSSARHCVTWLAARADVETVTLCSDAYHLPRCRLVFRILGRRCRTAAAPGGRRAVGTARWLRAVLRELPAVVWDAGLALAHRRRTA